MSEYVVSVLLEVNGQNIDDFKAVTEGEFEVAKQINLMNKTGFGRMTARHGVEVDYVVPADKAEFDFKTVEDGTLTIDKQNGVRTTYTGVWTLKVGATKYDGENEVVRTITFGATGKVE
ncbi:hypothetical protein [Desulfobulbus sp.]|uniref:hypothetical protein n=1 Tax=Desulfobulbus sp. TaxID=895 RepID=UPI00286F3D17|nr:hypothetical protein [Desulfobulbus sp.]